MQLKDIEEGLQHFLDLFLTWVTALHHPAETCDEILAAGNERDKLSKALRLWLVSFLVTLVLQFPIFHAVGIAWDDLGFHLPAFGMLTMTVVAFGCALHIGLRLFRIPSTLYDVISVYTAYVGVYVPLISLLSYPTSFRTFYALGIAKRQGLGLAQTVVFVFTQITSHSQDPGVVEVYNVLISWCTMFIIYTCTGMMAVTIARRYSVLKPKAFTAVGFSSAVLGPLFVIVPTLLYYFTVYSSTADKGPMAP
jgi:hypothetical protein